MGRCSRSQSELQEKDCAGTQRRERRNDGSVETDQIEGVAASSVTEEEWTLDDCSYWDTASSGSALGDSMAI